MKYTIENNFNGIFADDFYENKIKELENYLHEEKADLTLAIENNVPIGWVWSYLLHKEHNSFEYHIAYISICSDKRGLKIGHTLLNYVEEIAKRKESNYIGLFVTAENSNAVCFYKHEGFELSEYLLQKKIA